MSENSNASPWKDSAIWSRAAFVILFLLIFSLIAGPLAVALGVVQALFTIFTGAANRNLRGLAAALAEYVREILLFASWNSGRRPFPFSEFPSVVMEEDGAVAGEDDAVSGSESADARESAEAAAPKERDEQSAREKSSTGKAAAGESED